MALALAAPFLDTTNAGSFSRHPSNRRHTRSSFSLPTKSAAPCTLSLASVSASVAPAVDLPAQAPLSIVPFPGDLDIPEPMSPAPAQARRRANSLLAPTHPRRRARRASSLSPLNKPRASANSDLQLMRLVQRILACRLRSRSSSPAPAADSDEAMEVDEQTSSDVAELLAAQDRLLYERLSAYLAKRGASYDSNGIPPASPPQVVASLIMRHNDRSALRARSRSRSAGARESSPSRKLAPRRVTSPLGSGVQA
ncbi:hypothetical protein HDZ31DRAFT_66148 [Schizophyllum fasciatum]